MINRDEKLTIEKILLLTTLFVQPFFAYAQTAKQDWTKRWSIEAKGGWGYMIPCDEYAQELIRTHHSSVYSLQMSHRALATDSCQYDQLFGFPSLSVGLLFADYHRIKLQKENTPYISGTGYMMGANQICTDPKWQYLHRIPCKGPPIESRTHGTESRIQDKNGKWTQRKNLVTYKNRKRLLRKETLEIPER